MAKKPNKPDAPTMQDLDAPSSIANQTLKRMTPPMGSFDPDAAWKHMYRDMSSFNKSAQGEVSLTHKPGGLLHIESFRNCISGYRFFTIADLKCAAAGWHAPVSWTVESKVAETANGPAYMNTGLTKKAQLKDGKFTIQEAAKSRTAAVRGIYNCKWCLLDGIGRLPKLGTTSIEFTLIDEYDELCPEQRIVFRGKKKVKTKTKTIEISCFQHTGEAMTPGVFYVDTAGRVLLYLAGMQMLGLAKANNESTGI